MTNKYLIWVCKCKKTYALEIKAPKSHKCKGCNNPFPTQEDRDIMEREQLHPSIFLEV